MLAFVASCFSRSLSLLDIFLYFPLAGCVVPGAGAVEVAIAEALVNYKHRVQGRARLGIQAFADALLIIPKVQLSPGQITTCYTERSLITNCPSCPAVCRAGNGLICISCCVKYFTNLAEKLWGRKLTVLWGAPGSSQIFLVF